MRKLCSLLTWLIFLSPAQSTSYVVTFDQKVAASDIIARVSITQVELSKTPRISIPGLEDPRRIERELDSIYVCTARVSQALKGANNLKMIRFRIAWYQGMAIPNIGDNCFVYLMAQANGAYGVFEIRPIAHRYTEELLSKDHKGIQKETFTHDQYIAAILKSVSVGKDALKPNVLPLK